MVVSKNLQKTIKMELRKYYTVIWFAAVRYLIPFLIYLVRETDTGRSVSRADTSQHYLIPEKMDLFPRLWNASKPNIDLKTQCFIDALCQ